MQHEHSPPTSRRSQPRWWTCWLKILLPVLAVLVVAALVGFLLARSLARRGWPAAEGTLTVVGLRAPVTVVRDRHGVPHLYAAGAVDLHFAQGYVHAQDRFWGMELQRRRGQGTLADLLGDQAQPGDQAWQTLDLTDVAARELAALDAKTRASLDAYAAGVNAWLETERLPFEFTLLSWRGRPPPNPAPWTAADSLVVALVVGWQLSAPPIDPALAAEIVGRVGPDRGAFLLGGDPVGLEDSTAGLPLQFPQLATEPLPDRWLLGSQVTLVGGNRTASGKPLLAVDLPTDLTLPTPWYLLAWQVDRERAAGVSLPGLPGLLVGTDDAAAWEAWIANGEPAPGETTPPWQRWLLGALWKGADVVRLDDDRPPRTLAEMQTRQMDTYSARAARLIPFLLRVQPEGWRQERVTGMLRKWDYRVGDNNKESPFFTVYQLELARTAFADELGADLFAAYVARSDLYQAALDQVLQDPDDPWWDDVTTPQRELRGDVLKGAYEPALEWIGRNYGDLHVLWEWDVVHGSRLHHPLGDAWPWDQLLSRDLYPNGWADTANASPGGLPCLGGVCQGGDFYRAKAVFGYRQILDAGDSTTLWFTLLPGQSGHPFHPHAADLLDEWLAGQYLPLHLVSSPAEVEGAASTLVLTPKDTQD